MKEWIFTPLDSCFFRGAQPFNAGEGGFLDSMFPPTAQTMSGVIRSAMGEADGVDWEAYRERKMEYLPVSDNPDDAEALQCSGPYLLRDSERLFPVPLNLLHSTAQQRWTYLVPSNKSFLTDKQHIRLPEPVTTIEGGKTCAQGWLSQQDMNSVLAGDLPIELIEEKNFLVKEARTGIGRDNRNATVLDGQLYFTRHLRLEANISLSMQVQGGGKVKPDSMVRLGGEGRMAALKIQQKEARLPNLPKQDGDGFVLYLLTHGDFLGRSEPPLSDKIQIISACVGKVVREGGWDYRENRAKPLKSLIPAGSCYFIEGDRDTIRALHGTKIGERTAFGYGEVAIGIWRK